MSKISPQFWFDTQAKQAAEFYVSVFPNSRILTNYAINSTPSGSVDCLTIELAGTTFGMISAGPMFKVNPSISFVVSCQTTQEVDEFHAKLSKNGKELMPLGEYPFSKRFAWIEDAFGVSWQVMQTDEPIKQMIRPMMMFVGAVCGKAQQAIDFYTKVFKNSNVGNIVRYGDNEAPDAKGTIKQASFVLEGEHFIAMDSAHKHEFAFSEGCSLLVNCADQAEMDYFVDSLSADPDAIQCGWIKDPFGVSWQIVPAEMDTMMANSDAETLDRVTKAMLSMKRLNLAELKKAQAGE
jgi:predicted 3-demethylubiquinone-9 3-methyltransferase (glyoxalase superfamily)